MNRILLTLVLGVLLSLTAAACPVYPVGKIKIVDENNQVISNAKVWKYYVQNDSFQMRKGGRFYDEPDSNYYYIYSGNRRFWDADYKGPDKLFRIQAEGFIDVIIKGVQFTVLTKWDEEAELPALVITLYGNKYIKQNNSITLLDHVVIKNELIVTDTADFHLKDYFIATESPTAFTDEAIAKISTYPNPVVKELHVKVNYETREMLYASISDAQGRLVEELLVEGGQAIANLEGYKPGNYYVVVKDAKGIYLHRQLIIKL